jgi:predicted TIM-barrel fold metal-dependent hydrolase
MRVIDFHAHLFTRAFFDALAGGSPLPGTPEERLGAVQARTGLELPDPDPLVHGKRWLAELEAHDVAHMVGFASHPAEVPQVRAILEAAEGRMTGMAMVDPTQEGAADRVEDLLADGRFRGVLTFPAMHRFEVGGEAARDVLSRLSAVGGVCYVHCGLLVVKLRDLLGLPRGYDLRYANPLAVVPAADAFPGVTFVVPHFGAGFLRETLMLGAQCPNVVVDTSSSNGWLRTQPDLTLREVFARALDVFGCERVLFGTDSGTFPAGWRADRRDEQADLLADLGLGEDERALVLGGNAARVLGLS